MKFEYNYKKESLTFTLSPYKKQNKSAGNFNAGIFNAKCKDTKEKKGNKKVRQGKNEIFSKIHPEVILCRVLLFLRAYRYFYLCVLLMQGNVYLFFSMQSNITALALLCSCLLFHGTCVKSSNKLQSFAVTKFPPCL